MKVKLELEVYELFGNGILFCDVEQQIRKILNGANFSYYDSSLTYNVHCEIGVDKIEEIE